jgi:hypothetical protein
LLPVLGDSSLVNPGAILNSDGVEDQINSSSSSSSSSGEDENDGNEDEDEDVDETVEAAGRSKEMDAITRDQNDSDADEFPPIKRSKFKSKRSTQFPLN